MEKIKHYEKTTFSSDVLKAAVTLFDEISDKDEKTPPRILLTVERKETEWHFDTEAEFFADYRNKHDTSYFLKNYHKSKIRIHYCFSNTTIEVEFPDRERIEKVFEVFEKHHKESIIPEPPPPPPPPPFKPTIFIGHGRHKDWRELKDHLHEKHGYEVHAYEIGARAGHQIRDILVTMLKSNFAILVMTGEQKTASGGKLARQNVIHELGLFQGKLGFNRAIVLLEKGTKVFSNIAGVHQIRYKKGRIKETFGEVLATLSREFGKK